jgi:hypothetical protein
VAIEFTNREFSYLQKYTNEMVQTAVLRTGPTGPVVISTYQKFLTQGPVDLTSDEIRFLLYALIETYNTSHSSIVKSQMGLQMQMLRPTVVPTTTSEVDNSGLSPGGDTTTGVSGTYTSQWDLLRACMRKLGRAPLPPAPPLPTGITGEGDVYGISTPTRHDIDDGTGYNHR